jgi:hypothetical protein
MTSRFYAIDRHAKIEASKNRTEMGVADWRYEFVRGGSAATHKFIPGLSNTEKSTNFLEE